MAFMIRASLSDSPATFLIYCIIRYALMAFFSIALLRLTKNHTLAAWRFSMVFSVLQILAIICLDNTAEYFPYAVAVFSALESVLYWRPKMYFDVVEVSDDRRIRFKSLSQILIEIAKIVMPVVLGIVISNSSYTHTANIILVISIFQLLLSILFRPTRSPRQNSGQHKILDVMHYMLKHDSMHKIVYLSLLRGILTSSAGYLMVAQINMYRNTGSDLDLGVYTALASVFSIVILWAYRHFTRRYERKAIIFGLIPPVVLFPVSLMLFPGNITLSIAFYVFTQSVVESFLNGTVSVVRLQDITSRHLSDDSYRVEVESIAEVFLSVGRVVSISIVLAIIMTGQDWLMMPFALLSSLAIVPFIYLALPSKMWRHDKIKA